MKSIVQHINESAYQDDSKFLKLNDWVQVTNLDYSGRGKEEILDSGKVEKISTFSKTSEIQKHYSDVDKEDQPEENAMTIKVNGQWYVNDDVCVFTKI